MIIFQIMEFLATFVEILVGISTNAKILDERYKVKDNIIASFIIAFFVWILNQIWIFSVSVTVIGLIGIVISSCLIYKIKLIDSAALTGVYLLIVYIIDFLSITLFGVITKDTQFAVAVTEDLSYLRLYCLIFGKIFLCVVYLFLERKCMTKIRVPMMRLCIGAILTGVLTYILIENTYAHIDSDTFLLWSLFLLLVMAVIYLSIQVMLYIQKSNRMAMAVERNAILADNYKKAIKQYENEQLFYHDLKNQFLVIENYMRNKNFDKAEEYIEKLSFAHMQLPKQRTGIEVLDVLLEYKKREAERQGIHVEIVAEAIRLKLTEQETIALFGNLLDNAIEASSKVQGNIKWIRLAVRKIQEMIFIKISNSYKDSPVLKQDKFLSIKSDKRMHGLGMTSMQMIVEKYDGYMEADYDSENFTVVISFFN